MTSADFDSREFRSALGSFMTGVTVVTTRQDDGTPRGLTANSFSSVSLDPPLVLICIAKTAGTYDLFATQSHFAINVLAEDQQHVSARFASPVDDKFAGLAWRAGRLGSPILDECCAWFECTVEKRVDAGDHMILLGRVVDFAESPKRPRPLGYLRGAYLDLGLSESALNAVSGASARVGVILDHDDKIAFVRDPATGALTLPAGAHLGSAADPSSLLGKLKAYGIDATLNFLFSVYEDADANLPRVSIFYRGTVNGGWPDHSEIVLYPIQSIPWDEMGQHERSMLRRYARERNEDAFGVYAEHRRTVKPLAR